MKHVRAYIADRLITFASRIYDSTDKRKYMLQNWMWNQFINK